MSYHNNLTSFKSHVSNKMFKIKKNNYCIIITLLTAFKNIFFLLIKYSSENFAEAWVFISLNETESKQTRITTQQLQKFLYSL